MEEIKLEEEELWDDDLREEDGNEWLARLTGLKEDVARSQAMEGVRISGAQVPLCAGETWELTGAEGTGKSLLAVKAAVQVLVPKGMGGLGKSVAWLDCQGKLSPFVLNQQLARALPDEPKSVLDECLRRFFVLRPREECQLVDGLQSLQSRASELADPLFLIVVDGINDFRLFPRPKRQGNRGEEDKEQTTALLKTLRSVSRATGAALLLTRLQLYRTLPRDPEAKDQRPKRILCWRRPVTSELFRGLRMGFLGRDYSALLRRSLVLEHRETGVQAFDSVHRIWVDVDLA